MDFEYFASNINNIVAIVTGLVTLGGIWWGFTKWFWPLIRDIHTSFKQLDQIASEFRTNGGSSLRDVVNRLDETLLNVRDDAIKMEARQWAIVATLKDPIFEANEVGEYVRANPAYLALVERSVEEISGNGWENVILPEDRSRVWGEWHDAVVRMRTFETSYRVRSTSGAVYQVTCVAVPYFAPDEKSNLLGYLGRFDTVKRLSKAPTE